MKNIEVQKHPINLKELRLRPVFDPPPDTVIVDSDATVYCDGEIVAGFRIVSHDYTDIRGVLRSLKYQKTERTGGLPTNSRIFGCSPRLAIRKDFCAKCQLAIESPAFDAVLKYYGQLAENVYATTNPMVYAHHKELVKGVRDEWRMDSTVWTQGIVNWNNQLRYHKDQGNFPNTWNAMFTFKRDIGGGWLYFPEYKMAFALADGSVSTFNGQNVLHGVTPIRLLNKNSYRYTIVYYSLAQTTKCQSAEEELRRIKMVKTAREKKRAVA